MYADDAKVYRTIQSKMDEVRLQSTLNKLKEWSDTWLLKLNIDKCKVVSYSVRDKIDTGYYITEGNSVDWNECILLMILESFSIQLYHSVNIQLYVTED